MKQRHILPLIFAVLLAGCATQQETAVTPTPRGVIDPAEAKLAEAASAVSKSIQSLAEIQEATTPPPKNYRPPDPASYGMANLVSVDWSGPIEPLIQQIANSTGYKVQRLGKAPAIPIMISIYEKNTPIGNILRDAGYQAGDRADVVLFPAQRIIELRYAQT